MLVTRDQVPPGRNVSVLGHVRPGDGQVDAVLAETDRLALASRLDQWPNAVLEAMAAGVAPVVSNAGGLPNMVENGVTGIVLGDDSDDMLRATLTRLLDDPAGTRTLGRAARAHIEAEMNVTSTANRLFDLVGQSADLGRRHR